MAKKSSLRRALKPKPRTRTNSTRTTAKNRPVRSQGRATPRRGTPRSNERNTFSFGSLSPERKLDVIGILLALSGLLMVLSLLSSQRSAAIGWLVQALYKLTGWGAFLLPLALIFLGLWLVFRHVSRLPRLSIERVTGLILLYLNLSGWLHLAAGGGWQVAAAGHGGGYLGALIERGLVTSIGVAGAIIVLLAWLLVALAFTLDVSIPELFNRLQNAVKRQAAPAEKPVTPAARNRDSQGTPPPPPLFEDEEGGTALPGGFQPFEKGHAQPTARPQPGNIAHNRPAILPGEGDSPSPVQPRAAGTPGMPRSTSATAAVKTPWQLPAIESVLEPASPAALQSNLESDRARIIEETLASFGVPGRVVEVHVGPTVTQFGVEPEFIETRTGRTRVRVGKIVGLQDDLALALAASSIRIQAPVPGRNFVGIEVPNTEITRVTLREVVESDSFRKMRSPLRFALGKDVAGKSYAADLANMPHLLIAGTTGSGKSVCVNSLLCCFLLHNTPAELRLVLVDPKRVELTGYNGIPHLLAPVITDAERVIGALGWVMREMDSRYHKFVQNGVRNINEYNTRFPEERLPFLLVVIDELADLMMLAPDETERSITRLAQLARATGIHLVIATQRPSVDVVTGLIKANFPARVAFAVFSAVDSRVILDQPGAERLLGRGDMLFQAPDASAPVRLQGCYVSDVEIQRLVTAWKIAAAEVGPALQVQGEAVDGLPRGVPLTQVPLFDKSEEESDPLYQEAVDLVRREGRASVTMLQRRMRIGYTRAARLVDVMEERGIVGAAQANSQVREVLDYGPTAPPPDD